MQENIGSWLTKRALLTPDVVAYIDDHHTPSLTFSELNARANKIANALREKGVASGDRVALLLMNSPEFVELYFGLAKVGAVIVPLNWRLVADELEFIVKNSGAESLVFGDEFIEQATELHRRGDKTDVFRWLHVAESTERASYAEDYVALRETGDAGEPTIVVGGDDMLFIMYTSGTTGLPKGVVHTHRTSAWGAMTIAATVYYREGDVFLSPLPMFHVGALTPMTVNLYRGVTSVVMRTFDPIRAWELIDKHRVTTALAVPAMLNFMLAVGDLDRFDFSQLRWCLSGAAPVPESLIQAYADLGIEIHQVYGLTESCGPACVIDSKNALKYIGSTGKEFFHTQVRIVDGRGQDCPPDTPGEILVRGEHNMKEYWRNPEATAETIVDGWLHTGDIGRMNDEGFVYIEDRLKDMIISGGENVYPAEIEKLLMEMDGVRDCAVIGQSSERWGESPFAIVVPAASDLNAADVLSFCNGRLARFKMPCGVAFAEEIPRNSSGKILKRILRDQYPGPAPS